MNQYSGIRKRLAKNISHYTDYLFGDYWRGRHARNILIKNCLDLTRNMMDNLLVGHEVADARKANVNGTSALRPITIRCTRSRGPRGFFCLHVFRRGPVNVAVIRLNQSVNEPLP